MSLCVCECAIQPPQRSPLKGDSGAATVCRSITHTTSPAVRRKGRKIRIFGEFEVDADGREFRRYAGVLKRVGHGMDCCNYGIVPDGAELVLRQIVRARFRTKEKAHHKSLPKEIEATPPRQGNDKIPMETGILTGVDVLERSAQGNDKIPEMQGNFNGVALPGRSDQESDIPPEDQGDLSRLAKRAHGDFCLRIRLKHREILHFGVRNNLRPAEDQPSG